VVAHFEATVPPGGESQYVFGTTGQNSPNPAPSLPVSLTDNGGIVTVDTGVLKFVVRQNGFNLFDEVWLDTNGDGSYAASERIVAPSASHGPVFTGRVSGDVQLPSGRNDLRLAVEESGPMRVVIRVSGNTIYNSTADHRHGFAARIYAYAGKSTVKVDYQLQNSAKTKSHAWPLYFDDVSLEFRPELQNPTVRLSTNPGSVFSGAVAAGRYLFQSSLTAASVQNSNDGSTALQGSTTAGSSSFGWADLSDSNRGVFVTVRHMAEMWPNGIEVAPDNRISVRLWPKWSAQFHNNQISPTGLYWLEDMQHVYKEVLYYFHAGSPTSGALTQIAQNFQYGPVPFVPPSEYRSTGVTLDLGGALPSGAIAGTDTKAPPLYTTNPASASYNYGWRDFGGDVGRKVANGTGGVPQTASLVMGTARVDAWLAAERRTFDNLNCRPQWMAEYSFEDDFDSLQLEDRYGAATWRRHLASDRLPSGLYADADYLPGTGFGGWHPRDNEHAWFYDVEEFYYVSANPWIRDWYVFLKEFRKGERSSDTYLSNVSLKTGFTNERNEGHSWANAIASYRVTGDPAMLSYFRDRMKDSVEGNRNLGYGIWDITWSSGVRQGFFARAMIQLLTEARDGDPDLAARTFNILWGIMEWNRNAGNFSYGWTPATSPGASAGSGGPLGDPQAWFATETRHTGYRDHLLQYIQGGLNGGQGPYNNLYELDAWRGGISGRAAGRMREATFSQPPAPVANLRASTSGGDVRVDWTTPPGARRFHVLWSTEPISTAYTLDPTIRNVWACTPVGNTLVGQNGASQGLDLENLPSGQTVYVVVFCFGSSGEMSEMSNMVSVTVP
jgi:hypothetical protein